MSGRQDMYAQCPFYRRAEKQLIVCEGVEENATLHLAFASSKRLSEYKGKYCDKDYCKCLVAEMLERKWEDE